MRRRRTQHRIWKILLTSLACALVFVPLAVRASATDALEKAQAFIQQGRFADADTAARAALNDPQTAPLANAIVGALKLQQKDAVGSLPYLKKAVQLRPSLIGAELNLAQAYSLLGKQDDALAAYYRVLQQDASNNSALTGIAFIELARKRYGSSLEAARHAAPFLKETPDGLLLLATDYLAINDKKAAAALATDWLQLTNVSPDWSQKFALLLANHDLPSEALRILEHAKKSDETSYELAFNLAGVYLLQNNLPKALENYETAAAIKPDSLTATRQAAEIAERNAEFERSLSWWIRAKKLKPDDADTLFGFGRVCLRMDLLEDAEPALARAVQLKPQEASFRYVLASARVGKKQFESAERLLRALIVEKPQDAELHYALGAVYYLEAKLDEAEPQLRESVRLNNHQLAAWYYLGLVARDEGKNEDAAAIFEQILKKHPAHAATYEALGTVLVSMRRYPDARQNLERAVELNPKSVKGNYQLGLLLTRMGSKQEAAKRLELARSLREDDQANSRLQMRLLNPEEQ